MVASESIRFRFASTDKSAPENAAGQDRLFLDVGGGLRPGVISHRHLIAFTGSTSAFVLMRPELIGAAVRPDRRSESTFDIILHKKPDLDCVVSTYLATAYLATQTFPAGAAHLVRYVDLIEQGGAGFTLELPFTLYAAYLRLLDRLARRQFAAEEERWQEWLRLGHQLVTYTLQIAERDDISIRNVDAFATPGLFETADRDAILLDRKRYESKLREPACQARIASLRLPGQFGGAETVDALLVRDVQNASDPERCMFLKDWARTDRHRSPRGQGFVALSVFMNGGPKQNGCIISVKPDSQVSLRGLTVMLESAEFDRRRHLHGVDDRERDPITQEPKVPVAGYENADPWYDGRAHNHTIVWSPQGSGTCLTVDQIEQILLEFGSAVASSLPEPGK